MDLFLEPHARIVGKHADLHKHIAQAACLEVLDLEPKGSIKMQRLFFDAADVVQ